MPILQSSSILLTKAIFTIQNTLWMCCGRPLECKWLQPPTIPISVWLRKLSLIKEGP